ncbi:FmdB family zinc ribbon protein [Neisseria sp. Ec49-e6-T10]|uniref:FmdB family zinc ribbon protein n=1 Tax=Neisseria sp. Ec49-e6-T10 TaxID=3140744 RepID=UPI003EBEBAF0
MPIYEYICDDCGVKEEFLQKLADAPISVCSKCGSTNFHKCVSAAGFQLKGSGWYQSDFKQTVPSCQSTGTCDGCGS